MSRGVEELLRRAGYRGQLQEEVPLAPHTTWRMGGPARWLALPRDKEDLAILWRNLPDDLPRFVLGRGSNLLVVDEGFAGVVVALHGLHGLRREAETAVVEAGVTTSALAHFARHHALTGAEFLGGIPGTVGGALRMNAGAYGGEVRGILKWAELMDGAGECHRRTPEQLAMAYRQCHVPSGWIFLGAVFDLQPGDPEKIRQQMREQNQKRRSSQPLAYPSAGSTFKNPPGQKAWQLIDRAGMRGEAVGDAQVSEQHGNFLINRGRARAVDMMTLIERVQERVAERCGVHLALEVAVVQRTGLREER